MWGLCVNVLLCLPVGARAGECKPSSNPLIHRFVVYCVAVPRPSPVVAIQLITLGDNCKAAAKATAKPLGEGAGESEGKPGEDDPTAVLLQALASTVPHMFVCCAGLCVVCLHHHCRL